MRLLSYLADGRTRAGIQRDDGILDTAELARVAGLTPDIDWTSNRALLRAGREPLERLRERAESAVPRHALADAVLGPPIPDPDKIICVGLNYRDHGAETGLELPEVPVLFAKFPNALIGHGQPIVMPGDSDQVDYEAELAVVIGRTAKDVPVEQALAHVAGVMCFNDVSARDLQFRTSQFTAGKICDTFAPCGPALVSLDGIADIQDLPIRARVNGRVVQDSSTAAMIFSVAEAVAFISTFATLQPGDIVATGTPGGVGFTRTPPLFLTPGDMVEVEIAGVGTLRNPVASTDRRTP